MTLIRLDKLLADAGLGTRSQVKDIIKKKRVSVNGTPVKNADIKINLESDEIVADGKTITYREYEYYMLNKPAGVVSAVTDKRDKTVIELINVPKRRDLFPVGRLDKDTEGLLLITNDGQLANNLLSPNKHIDKKYYAIINGLVTDKEIESFKQGLDIGEEKLTKPAILKVLSTDEVNNESEIEVIITEGKYHQVKRMFEAVDMKVTYLKRLEMGSLVIDDSLELGEFRELTEQEISSLINNK